MTISVTRRQTLPLLFVSLFAALLLATSLPSPVAAQNATPTAVVQTVVNAILDILRKPDFSLDKDRVAIRTEIRKRFDDTAMAQSVLSTNWRTASPAQQTEFKELLMQTIESTYIGRIQAYSNESVDFRSEQIDDKRATVETVVKSQGTEIPVTYKLRLRSDGWFVYDVEIENVSMVSSYRDTYRSVVKSAGMDGLLDQMRKKLTELGA